jgi:hypothetical protein
MIVIGARDEENIDASDSTGKSRRERSRDAV